MKIFLDTNILLDFVTEREGVEEAKPPFFTSTLFYFAKNMQDFFRIMFTCDMQFGTFLDLPSLK